MTTSKMDQKIWRPETQLKFHKTIGFCDALHCRVRITENKLINNKLYSINKYVLTNVSIYKECKYYIRYHFKILTFN